MGRWQWWCVCVVKQKSSWPAVQNRMLIEKPHRTQNATQSKIRLLPIPVVYSLNMDLHTSKHGYYQSHFIQSVQYWYCHLQGVGLSLFSTGDPPPPMHELIHHSV